jgi:hypothetical protein
MRIRWLVVFSYRKHLGYRHNCIDRCGLLAYIIGINKPRENMKDHKETYTPTEDEIDAIDRAGLEAAWLELQALNNDDLPMPKKVLACLQAFKATNAAVIEAKSALKSVHPEASYIQHFSDVESIVCSAFMGLDFDGTGEIHPNSVLGERLLSMIRAAKVLDAMSTVDCVFEEDDSIFGTYLADEATMLAQKKIGC